MFQMEDWTVIKVFVYEIYYIDAFFFSQVTSWQIYLKNTIPGRNCRRCPGPDVDRRDQPEEGTQPTSRSSIGRQVLIFVLFSGCSLGVLKCETNLVLVTVSLASHQPVTLLLRHDWIHFLCARHLWTVWWCNICYNFAHLIGWFQSIELWHVIGRYLWR